MSRFTGPYKTIECRYKPPQAEMERDVIYLCTLIRDGEPDQDAKIQCAGFICPCGCGQEVFVPVNAARGQTNWALSLNENKQVTFAPSIWDNQKECQSHYFIRNGLVEWC